MLEARHFTDRVDERPVAFTAVVQKTGRRVGQAAAAGQHAAVVLVVLRLGQVPAAAQRQTRTKPLKAKSTIRSIELAKSMADKVKGRIKLLKKVTRKK